MCARIVAWIAETMEWCCCLPLRQMIKWHVSTAQMLSIPVKGRKEFFRLHEPNFAHNLRFLSSFAWMHSECFCVCRSKRWRRHNNHIESTVIVWMLTQNFRQVVGNCCSATINHHYNIIHFGSMMCKRTYSENEIIRMMLRLMLVYIFPSKPIHRFIHTLDLARVSKIFTALKYMKRDMVRASRIEKDLFCMSRFSTLPSFYSIIIIMLKTFKHWLYSDSGTSLVYFIILRISATFRLTFLHRTIPKQQQHQTHRLQNQFKRYHLVSVSLLWIRFVRSNFMGIFYFKMPTHK